MKTIPENFTEFLYWIKQQTETFWAQTTNQEEWNFKAKWIGLTDEQINETEKKFCFKFTAEHREFLRVLHTLDRKEKTEYTESFDNNAEILVEEKSFFYNWLEDHEELIYRLKYPFNCISESVTKQAMWLKSWGEKPDNKNERVENFIEIYKKSPQLLPIHSHRFLVSDCSLKYNPVLSIWGTDTIIYGWTLRTYLINELKYFLDIWEEIYDEEDQRYYTDLNDEARKIYNDDYKYDKSKVIPIWQEIILDHNKFWSCFGLENPPNSYTEAAYNNN